MEHLAEALVYGSVWVALAGYPAAGIGRGTEQPSVGHGARWIWTLGCLAFWLHSVSAFGVVYGWSHGVAVEATARQTLEATGFDSGFGIYLNYLFAFLWLVDAVWWWVWPRSYRGRSLRSFLLLHGFFLFMILNGAVLFVDGPRRWLGALIVGAGLASVIWATVRERQPLAP